MCKIDVAQCVSLLVDVSHPSELRYLSYSLLSSLALLETFTIRLDTIVLCCSGS